jgi:hypothetical protein
MTTALHLDMGAVFADADGFLRAANGRHETIVGGKEMPT